MKNIAVDVEFDLTEVPGMKMVEVIHNEPPYPREYYQDPWCHGWIQYVPTKACNTSDPSMATYPTIEVIQSMDDIERDMVVTHDRVMLPVPACVNLVRIHVNSLHGMMLQQDEPGYLFGFVMSEQEASRLQGVAA